MVVDSLRYWVTEMHVDGFRFDLASALARGSPDFNPMSNFFAVLRRIRCSRRGSHRGAVGPRRDRLPGRRLSRRAGRNGTTSTATPCVRTGRRRGAHRRLRAAGSRIPRPLRPQRPRPHGERELRDGARRFTLADLVTYNKKHNEANGEDNRDGSDNNLSWNLGVEGPTTRKEVVELRERQKRNLLATLLLSQGVPMLHAGDEVSHTQGGNNNAYCQDNETSWHDWTWDDAKWHLLNFTKKVVRFRREHPLFAAASLPGGNVGDSGRKDVAWLKPDGHEMTTEEWEKDFARCLGMWLNGEELPETDERGRALHDDSFLVLFNAHHDAIDFTLPQLAEGWGWRTELDTSSATASLRRSRHAAGHVSAAGPIARDPARGLTQDHEASHSMPFGAQRRGAAPLPLWAPAARGRSLA
jgi:glycogen operon protein